MLTIALCTRLHHGISGGGKIRTVSTWNAGPINARRAEKALHTEQVENIQNYGSIGCGHSWLELRQNQVALPVGVEGVESAVKTARRDGLAALMARYALYEAERDAQEAKYYADLEAVERQSTNATA